MAKNNKGNSQVNYMLNLEEIMKFVFDSENNRNTDSEINEFYENKDGEIKLSNKTIREIKARIDSSAESTIRYDLIKMFISSLFDMPSKLTIPEELSLGDTIVLNTMLNNNMLMEINNTNI